MIGSWDQMWQWMWQMQLVWMLPPLNMLSLNVELEHGPRDPATNVTGRDPVITGKLALAHVKELPAYYTRLAAMQKRVTEPRARTARRAARTREWT
jgi:hypothetical protein